MPLLKPLIDKTPAVNGYPSNKPQQQPIGTNRFLLYFFAPEPERDLVSDPADPYFIAYRAGLDYEAYLESPRYLNRIAAIQNNPDYISASRAALERLFTKDFLDKVEARTYQFANTGNFTFASDDGQFSTTVTGNGKAPVEGIAGAATMLYKLCHIAPGLKAEAGADFTKYFPPELASESSFKQEAEQFTMSGPGFAEAKGITHKMARLLVKDFFDEVDAIAHGDCATPPCSALAMRKPCCHWLSNLAFPACPNPSRKTSAIRMKTVHGVAHWQRRWRSICGGTRT
jgi:hypothetical protein